jgi:hypothetical protein
MLAIIASRKSLSWISTVSDASYSQQFDSQQFDSQPFDSLSSSLDPSI